MVEVVAAAAVVAAVVVVAAAVVVVVAAVVAAAAVVVVVVVAAVVAAAEVVTTLHRPPRAPMPSVMVKKRQRNLWRRPTLGCPVGAMPLPPTPPPTVKVLRDHCVIAFFL